MRVGGEFSENFVVEVGVRQGLEMSPWLFNIFMDGCMRKMNCKVVNVDVKLRLNGELWSVVTCLFAGDTVLLAESEGDLQRVVTEFYSVCKRRKSWVNAGKSKVMVFDRRGEEVTEFNTAYRAVVPKLWVMTPKRVMSLFLGIVGGPTVSTFSLLEWG